MSDARFKPPGQEPTAAGVPETPQPAPVAPTAHAAARTHAQAQPQAQAQPRAQTPQAPAPQSVARPRIRRRIAVPVLVGVVAVLAVVGLVAIPPAIDRARDAAATESGRAAVQHYMDLISAKDWDAANAIVAPDVPEEMKELVSSRTAEHVTSAVIVTGIKPVPGPSTDDDAPEGAKDFVVDYALNGRGNFTSITAAPPASGADGADGAGGPWRVIDTFASRALIHVPDYMRAVAVGDVEVPLPDDAGPMVGIDLYPGQYTMAGISAAPEYMRFSEATQSVDWTGSFRFVAERSGKLQEAIHQKAADHLRWCAAREGTDPASCGTDMTAIDVESIDVDMMPDQTIMDFDGATVFRSVPVTFHYLSGEVVERGVIVSVVWDLADGQLTTIGEAWVGR